MCCCQVNWEFKGGKRKWKGTLVQLAGFPIQLLFSSFQHPKISPQIVAFIENNHMLCLNWPTYGIKLLFIFGWSMVLSCLYLFTHLLISIALKCFLLLPSHICFKCGKVMPQVIEQQLHSWIPQVIEHRWQITWGVVIFWWKH